MSDLPSMKAPANLYVRFAEGTRAGETVRQSSGAFGDLAFALVELDKVNDDEWWIESVTGSFTSKEIADHNVAGRIQRVN